MLVEKEIYGSRMLLDTEDPGLSADLWKDGKREWDCPEITESILKPGMVCLDIGCNLGMYALMECRIIGPKGFVYAIEPVERSADIFRQSLALNGYRNCSVHILAIGNKDGLNHFLVRPESNLCRMRWTKARPVGGDIVEVPELTLDTFCAQHEIKRIDFLRYDIESYETALIEGAQKTLASMKPGSWMFGEWHTCHFEDPVKDMQPALENLIGHGFIPRRVQGAAVEGMEDIPAKDFAKVCCEKYWDQAPRIFFEKVG